MRIKKMGERGKGKVVNDRRETMVWGWGGGGEMAKGGVRLFLPLDSRGTITYSPLNPLGPKSDQHQFSPNNISRSSRVKFMRITKLITKGRML